MIGAIIVCLPHELLARYRSIPSEADATITHGSLRLGRRGRWVHHLIANAAGR